jgi:hypothetical protein
VLVGRERFVERPHIVSLLGAGSASWSRSTRWPHRPGGGPRASASPCARASRCGRTCTPGRSSRPLLLVAAAAGGLARSRSGRGAPSRAHGAGAAAAVFATPIGFGLIRYLRLHLSLPALHPVDEFRAPSWLSDSRVLRGSARRFLLSLIAVGRRRVAWTIGLPVLVVALLALRSVRFAADAALIAAPLLATNLTAIGDRLRCALAGGCLASRSPRWRSAALLIGMAGGPRIAGPRRRYRPRHAGAAAVGDRVRST